jgi:hypothetical protein
MLNYAYPPGKDAACFRGTHRFQQYETVRQSLTFSVAQYCLLVIAITHKVSVV